MREKEPIVGNTDCGKDEDSAEVCSLNFVLVLLLSTVHCAVRLWHEAVV